MGESENGGIKTNIWPIQWENDDEPSNLGGVLFSDKRVGHPICRPKDRMHIFTATMDDRDFSWGFVPIRWGDLYVFLVTS